MILQYETDITKLIYRKFSAIYLHIIYIAHA